jgi:nucleoid-associated protein YgaU
MKHLHVPYVLGSVLLATLLAQQGCARSGPSAQDMQMLEAAGKAESHQAQRTIMELRGEAQGLQRELGAARAAQARLEGELREAQRRVLEAQRAVDAQREESARIREDRDHLAQAGRDQTRIQTLEAAIDKQTQEMADLKTAMQKIVTQSKTKLAVGRPAVPISQEVGDRALRPGVTAAPALRTMTVQSGDTLWDLARKYRVDLLELKARNNLATDRLVPGQELVLP